MFSRKSAAPLASLAVVLALHGAAFFVALYGLTMHQSEPPPPPLSMTVQVLAAPEPAPETTPPVIEQSGPSPNAPPTPPVPAPKPVAGPQPSKRPAVKKAEIEESKPEGSKPVLPQPEGNTNAATSSSAEPTQSIPATPPARAAQLAPPAQVKTSVSIPATYKIGNRPPIYPRLSIQYREQGIVTLRVFVNADESAGDVKVKKSSGFPLLDQAAVSAVQTWRFEPARIDGEPVGEWYQVDIPFKLLN